MKKILSQIPEVGDRDLLESLDTKQISLVIREAINSELPNLLGCRIDRKSKINIGPGGGHSGESWCHFNPKRNEFQWLLDIDSEVTFEEFRSTLFHELIHVEQSARTVGSKSEAWLKKLKPQDKWYDIGAPPFGIGEAILSKKPDSYLEDPHEIEAFALELANQIKQSFDPMEIRAILTGLLEEPEALKAILDTHFAKGQIQRFLKMVSSPSRRKFLKILYMDLT